MPQETVAVPTVYPQSQLHCAAVYLYGVLDFRYAILSGKLQPLEHRGKFFSMHQYSKLFGSCRIPSTGLDYNTIQPESTHVIIILRNAFYQLQVCDESGKPYSINQLFSSLLAINSSESEPSEPIGYFTTLPRLEWAAIRTRIHQDNAVSLQAIQDSILTLSLLDSVPGSDPNRLVLESMASLTPGSRWHDKTIQLIVFKDGQYSCSMEHSLVDGAPADHMVSHASVFLRRKISISLADELPFQRLNWSIPLDLKLKYFENPHEMIRYSSIRHQLNVQVFKFPDFGVQALKHERKQSPDAVFQAAFQLAYYRTFKKIVATYESVGTTQFYHGRTETLRSVTKPMLSFIKDCHNKTKLLKALETHVTNTREARNGQGIDRHLLALRILAAETPVELFQDPIFIHSNTWQLSTSQLTGAGVKVFRPVTSDGLGIAYSIFPDHIRGVITSYEPISFSSALLQALQDIDQLLLNVKI